MPSLRLEYCVSGRTPTLLASRCLILNNEGYDAEGLNVDQGSHALQSDHFDVVIMSGTVAEEHGESMYDGPVNARSLLIEDSLFPYQLLAALKQKPALAAPFADRQEHREGIDGAEPRRQSRGLPNRCFLSARDNFVV